MKLARPNSIHNAPNFTGSDSSAPKEENPIQQLEVHCSTLHKVLIINKNNYSARHEASATGHWVTNPTIDLHIH